MLDLSMFKSIELADKKEITQYLQCFNTELCDYNFFNLYCWGKVFDVRWQRYKDNLIFYNSKIDYILMPCKAADIKFLLEISDTFLAANKSGNFILADADFVDDNNQILSQYFELMLDEEYTDYVYFTEKLVSLKGKKLHKKKNLISQFLRTYPNYSIKKLTSDYYSACFELAERWCLNKDCEKSGFSHEKSALANAFNAADILNFDGLLIFIDDNIVAFSIFSEQTPEMATVHFEKFDTTIKGSGQIINFETAKYLVDKYKYLNREQDMGLEGLRQAKRSYDPDRLLITYRLLRKK